VRKRAVRSNCGQAAAENIMKIIVLQHLAVEHPGIFRGLMRADGLTWDTVELDAGDPIPDLESYDLMMVMGGPQDVWQEERNPWLVAEKAAIRHFVLTLARPFFGICLGHQLLAEAVGGTVAPAVQPEVGVWPVTKTSAGDADPLLADTTSPLQVLQWHGAEVTSLPAAARILASSPACAVQAFRVGDHAWGLQFHVEATAETVPDWAAIPEYAAALRATLGPGAESALAARVHDHLADFNEHARIIYGNLMRAVAKSQAARVRGEPSVAAS
jgi:GMP synthase-like glutamine amidotransferase